MKIAFSHAEWLPFFEANTKKTLKKKKKKKKK